MSENSSVYAIFCNISTLNNQQNLYLEYLEATLLVNLTLAHGREGKPQCGMIGVPVIGLAERGSNHLMNGECSAVISDHSNRHCLF